MVCNPVCCLDRVAPWIAEPPGPLVPVEEWVAAGAKLIEEIGAEAYLRLLIENLRGEEPDTDAGGANLVGPVFHRLAALFLKPKLSCGMRVRLPPSLVLVSGELLSQSRCCC